MCVNRPTKRFVFSRIYFTPTRVSSVLSLSSDSNNTKEIRVGVK